MSRGKLLQRGFIFVFLFMVMLFYCVPVEAVVRSFSFPNFSDPVKNEQLQLNGIADIASNTLRITGYGRDNSRGSVFYKDKISLKNNRPFSVSFAFRAPARADGFTFCIHSYPEGVKTLYNGGYGSDLAYFATSYASGVKPSIALTFKTFNSTSVDLYLNASTRLASVGSHSKSSTNYVWLDYDGTYLDVRMNTTGVRPATPNVHYKIDLLSTIGEEAYIGFTGACGMDYGQHNIYSWDFIGNHEPTIDFTSLPAGSKIHKLENTLSFNIRASDPDPEDKNLTTTISLNGTQVNNFTARNMATGQTLNITNGQLTAVSGTEYRITINNKNTFVSSSLNSFKLKTVTKDSSNAQAAKEVTLTNYNTTPTIGFTSLPAGSKIHKLENTLTFNIKAADTDTAIDKNLTTTIYIRGTQVNNFTAKNLANGQISNISNGQLPAANGTEYQITINNKNTYVSSGIDNFELKTITKDNYGATNNKAVNINNYNTDPNITIAGLATDQFIPKHKPNFTFSITATDSDTIDQDLHVSFCLVTSTDGEDIGDYNRKEINVTEFIANGMNVTEGDLLAKNNTTYTITIDKSKLLTNDINKFILKAVVRDNCNAQGVREKSLIHSNAIPTIQFLDLTEGQIIRKSDNILDFRLIIEDQDREVDTELETEIYIGVLGAYRQVTEFTVNNILNTEGKFMAQNGTEYAITLNKGVLVPMYANEFSIKVIATDTCGEKGTEELSLVHYTDILAQWSLDSVKERIAVDSGGESNHGVIHDATLTTGIMSNAFEFDGIDDYVEVPLTPAVTITTSSFSIEAWVKTTDVPSLNDGIVCNFRTSSTPVWILGIYGDTEVDRGKYYFQIRDKNAVNAMIKSDTPLNDGQWHHLVGVRDAAQGKVRFYVDGALVGEAVAPPGDVNSGQSIYIGDTLSRYFQGCIDEVTLYGCALTGDDVERNYQKVVFLENVKITNKNNEETIHEPATFGRHENKIEFDLTKTVNELVIELDLPSNIEVTEIINIFQGETPINNSATTDGHNIILKQVLTPGHYKIEFALFIDDQLIVKTKSYHDEKRITTNHESEKFKFIFSDLKSLPDVL